MTRDNLPPGTLVGARITFGPPNARHEMLVLGDPTYCALRASQLEDGRMQPLSIAADDVVEFASPSSSVRRAQGS